MDRTTVWRAIGPVAILLYLSWRGVRARRRYWTGRSWSWFGAAVLASIAAFAGAIAMANAVDQGVYRGMGSTARQIYFVALTILGLGGAVALAGLVLWLGTGDPERRFGPRQSGE